MRHLAALLPASPSTVLFIALITGTLRRACRWSGRH